MRGRCGPRSRGQARFLSCARLQDMARAGILRPGKIGPGTHQGGGMRVWQDGAWCRPGQTHAGLARSPVAEHARRRPIASRAVKAGRGAEQVIYAGLARLGLVLMPGRVVQA